MPLPPYPRRRPSDKGSKNQVQAENANAPRKSSDSETDKFFTPTSDEEENSHVNNRTRRKKLFEPKKEEESEK